MKLASAIQTPHPWKSSSRFFYWALNLFISKSYTAGNLLTIEGCRTDLFIISRHADFSDVFLVVLVLLVSLHYLPQTNYQFRNILLLLDVCSANIQHHQSILHNISDSTWIWCLPFCDHCNLWNRILPPKK